jgi:hypothetical protein
MQVASIASITEAIKCQQVVNDKTMFTLSIGGAQFSVDLLSSGYIALDGKVPSLAVEKAFDAALATVGATLRTIN